MRNFAPLLAYPLYFNIPLFMNKLYVLLLGLFLLTGLPMEAKKKKETPQPPKKEEALAPVRPGLFGVQHQKDDWYFVIPDSLLGRPILTVTRFVTTPVGIQVHGGELANNQVLYWEKRGDQLLLRALMFDSTADSTAAIAAAVRNSAENPIIASLKIETTPKDSANRAALAAGGRGYRVKVTDLLKGDNAVIGMNQMSKTRFNVTALKGELSYVDTIKTFPINTEIISVKTYGAKPGGSNPSAYLAGQMTFRLNTSFVLLPKEPMRARTFDPRVGYFTDSFVEYSDAQQSVRRKTIATRWRLEPRPEDLDKYRRGELVEPQKPIVFYIDPATPKQWRKYLIMGVEDWQKAFEKAGFKNAIRAYEWPNDSTMSMEDARFSVIRYLASPVSNAYGPQIHDPRSGEILESHIGWYHNVMKLVHDWYFVQAGAVDERARKMQFDDELMGQLIRFVSSHEVGHTLGLRHNMGASSATPVENLRNKNWVEEHGHTASIMDYARFNYVAQPEDKIGDAGMFPRINDYDMWAIEWGYKYFPDAQSEKEERLALNRITNNRITGNRRLWFGGEGNDNDPCAQTEDLGDDAMKASTYGLKNLRYIVKHLPQWTYEEGDLGDNLEQMYGSVLGQFRRYIGHVTRNIGGIHHEYKSVEQTGAVYTPMTRERQKRALAWIDANVFTQPRWMISEDYVSRLGTSPEALIRPLAEMAVAPLVSATTFDRLARYAYGPQPYTPTEYIDDLFHVLFRETTTGARVGTWRRFIQQQAVLRLLKAWRMVPDSDGRPYTAALLRKIQSRLSTVRSADAATQAHYDDLRQQIKLAFEGK